MKKIVIDARESGTTTGRYVDKLIEYLHELRPAYQMVVLAKKHRLEYLRQQAPTFVIVECSFREFSFGEQLGFYRQLKSLEADLVHFPMAQQPVLYRGKIVTTMNDLTTVRFRNPAKNRLVFGIKQTIYKWLVRRVARKSAALLTYSEFIKNDVAEFAGINPNKITVTPLAAEPITAPIEPLAGLQDKQFIMYVGRALPHKNLERLVEAFGLLKTSHPDLMLVLAGRLDPNYRRLQKAVSQKGLKQVIFTDKISEGQLRWLYENCTAYVFPSLSEGFGLPGLEAMMHGAPVVSSRATCLPEVYGQAGHYFDPLNVNAMAKAIDEVLTDKSLRTKLMDQGHEQAKKYSWQRLAGQTLAVYKRVLGD